jgi:hypothetical protein
MKTKQKMLPPAANSQLKKTHFMNQMANYLVIFALAVFYLPFNSLAQNPGNLSIHPNCGIRSNSPVLSGDTLCLMATGGIQYQWAGPNNFSSTGKITNIPLATTANDGTYFCTVTDDIKDTVLTFSVDVEVINPAISAIICEPIICAYSDLQLSTTAGGPGATYQWTEQNSLWTSTGQYTTYISIQTPGTHTLHCEITYNGNTTTETTTVDVKDCCTTNPATLLHNINISAAPATLLPTIAVLGNLKIDVNYAFPSNSEIIMLPDAIMEVNQSRTLTLNNSIVRGCENFWMWYSIYLHDLTSIEMYNCTIRDAYNGIQVDNHSDIKFKLNLNHFDDNANAIAICSSQSIQWTQFNLNEFQSANYLFPSPLSGLAAFSGIYAYSVSLFFPRTDQLNVFHDMENGIFASERVQMIIPDFCTRFYNFNTTYPDPENPGHGIFSGPLSYLDKSGRNDPILPDFENCREGIEVTSTETYIRKNFMENMKIGIRANLNNGLVTNLIENTIHASDYGIKLFFNDPVREMLVEKNTIVLDGAPSGRTNACILINEGLNPITTPSFERIQHNQLIVENGTFGISSTTAYGTEILNNFIYLNQPDVNQSGIQLIKCLENIVREDTIIGIDPTVGNLADYKPQGLTVESTTSSMYQCNYFTDLMAGAAFYENCNPSNILTNTFNNHTIGLYYNKNAVTGTQPFKCNKWLGSYNLLKAKHESQDPLFVSLSRYDVNTIPPEMNPLPQVDPLNYWFISTLGPGAILYCGHGYGEGTVDETMNLNAVDTIVATDGLSYLDFNDEHQWNDAGILLAKLSNDSTLLSSNSIMTTFADSLINHPINSFNESSRELKTSFRLSPVTLDYLNTLKTQMAIYKDSLMIVDSLLHLPMSSPDSIQLSGIYQTLSASFRQTALYAEAALNGYRQSIENQSELLEIEIGLLPETSILEANEKKVNEIYLQSIAKGKVSFTQTQEEELLDIASQCTLSGGKAVYAARALYSLVSDTLFDDKQICLAEGLVKSQSAAQKTISENSFTFYPNPSTGTIHLQWNLSSEEKAECKIMNNLGQCVQYQRVDLNKLSETIQLSNLPNGSYYVQVYTDSKIISLGKLFIIK